jgi:hypothetical protein
MGYEPIVSQNPLRVLQMGGDKTGHFGLIMARAGLGKTALLVQIALDAILRGNRVMHVSIGESIDKTKAWYDDIIQEILGKHSVTRPHDLIDMVRQYRMIMTFKEASFSRSRLEERLNDLVLQDIFRPSCLVIDGFPFEGEDRAALEDIKEMCESMNLHAWFSAVSHRGDERVSPIGVPAPCHEVDDLFESVVLLKPGEESIRLAILKNDGSEEGLVGDVLNLDPVTMMARKA